MEIFIRYLILVFTHFFSDLFFQPASWAKNKTKHFLPLLYHSIQYTALFVPVLWFLKINFLWLALLFSSHLAIDNYKFVKFLNKVRGAKKMPAWLEIVQDQVLHLFVLLLILL
ncbi:MAG: DUF3307 domain-containing protein [Candidatus Pacearchaeota archaeon]